MNLEELVKKYAGETVANKVIVKVDGVREIAAVYEEAGLLITDRGAELMRKARTGELSDAVKEAAIDAAQEKLEEAKPKRRATRKPKAEKVEPEATEENVDGLFDFLGEDDAAGSD